MAIKNQEYITFYSYLLILYLSKILSYDNHYLAQLELKYLNKVNHIHTYLSIDKMELSSDLYLWAITHHDQNVAKFLKSFSLTSSFDPELFWNYLSQAQYLAKNVSFSWLFEDDTNNTVLKEKINNEYIINLICCDLKWVEFYYDNIELTSSSHCHIIQHYSSKATFFDYLNLFEQKKLEKIITKIAYQSKIDLTQAKKRVSFSHYQKQVVMDSTYIPSNHSRIKPTRNFWREDAIEQKQSFIIEHSLPSTVQAEIEKPIPASPLIAQIKPLTSSTRLLDSLIIQNYETLHALNFDEQKEAILLQLNKLKDYIEKHLYLFMYHQDKIQELNQNIYSLIDLCHIEYFNQDVFKTLDLVNLLAFVYPSLIKSYVVMLDNKDIQNQTHLMFKKSINQLIYLVDNFKSHIIATIEKNFKLATDEIDKKFSQFSFELRHSEERDVKF